MLTDGTIIGHKFLLCLLFLTGPAYTDHGGGAISRVDRLQFEVRRSKAPPDPEGTFGEAGPVVGPAANLLPWPNPCRSDDDAM
jgi:hypothetical protein